MTKSALEIAEEIRVNWDSRRVCNECGNFCGSDGTYVLTPNEIRYLAQEVHEAKTKLGILTQTISDMHQVETKKTEALKEAEVTMRKYIFDFDESENGMFENRARLIEFKEWLQKYGGEPK